MGQDAVLQKKPWDPSGRRAEHDSAMCLGFSSTRRTFKTWIESCKGPPSRWGAGTQDIQGQAEAAGFAQPAEEMLQGQLGAVCCYLMGGSGEDLSTLFPRCPGEGWEAAEQTGEFWPDRRKRIVHYAGGQTLKQNFWCPEKFWSLQPWRYWNLNWTQPQATQPSCPYFEQLVWLMASRSPFQIMVVRNAVILKLCCCFQAGSVPWPVLPPKACRGIIVESASWTMKAMALAVVTFSQGRRQSSSSETV